MDSFIYDDEESQFFDAQEHIAQEPDNGCSSSRNWGMMCGLMLHRVLASAVGSSLDGWDLARVSLEEKVL
ncbi:UNVERIFIED_CONTAM: hypothetical protein Slati_1217600 [Sesamum latifolium]|uniref:Uncharacterized protein n=1 Tax=Sesamum latifolium TaxID=2727402 RepID=A0AAW2XE41_9LAMI